MNHLWSGSQTKAFSLTELGQVSTLFIPFLIHEDKSRQSRRVGGHTSLQICETGEAIKKFASKKGSNSRFSMNSVTFSSNLCMFGAQHFPLDKRCHVWGHTHMWAVLGLRTVLLPVLPKLPCDICHILQNFQLSFLSNYGWTGLFWGHILPIPSIFLVFSGISIFFLVWVWWLFTY